MKGNLRRLLAIFLVLMLLSADICAIAEAVATLTLPSALQIIEEEAFAGNTSIEKVIVPDGTTEIGSKAFANSSLTEIDLPDSLSAIADDSFDGCTDLTITAPEGSYAYEWAVDKGYIPEENNNTTPPEAFTYEIIEGNFIRITGYTGSDMDVVVPSKIGDYVVKEIGNKTFIQRSDIVSISLPDTITSLGGYAFYRCNSLASIDISDSVTSIGDYCFYFCTSLTSVDIPEGITSLGDSCFSYCTNLTSIDVPDSVTSLGDSCFSLCTNLTSIDIPDSVTSLGDSCFSGCDSLTSIDIPDSITALGEFVFDGCDSLTSIDIPDSVTSLGYGCFRYCYNLTNIDIPDSVTSLGDVCFYLCNSLTSIDIPESVTSLGAGCFGDCYNLTSIVIPDRVTSLGDSCFKYCYSLTSIDIPDSVISLGESCFYSCDNLSSIDIPDRVTSLGDSCFNSCKSLTSIDIPEGVTSIGDECFDYCLSLSSIDIPDSVTSLGDYCFRYCENLISVTIGNSVATIGNNAFKNCSADLTIYGVAGSYAERYAEANGITFVADEVPVTPPTSDFTYEIIEGNFIRITGYTGHDVDLVVPSNIGNYIVKEIGDGAFSGNSYIVSISIPNTVTLIGDNAFARCKGLTSIDISDGVTSIGDDAFLHCKSLTSIDIPDSVTSLGDSCFNCCYSLSSINIPDGVTSIGDYCFQYCESLTSIDIPDGVTSLGNKAFAYCDNLESVELADSITSLGSYTFEFCENLKTIVIPSGVTMLDYGVFYYCKGLTEATLPAGLTTIGGYAFEGCDNLESIALPNSLTSIGDRAFDSSGLTNIIIPNSVTSIGWGAFQLCHSLEYIELSNNITSIKSSTFWYCTSLSGINIPEGVTTIADNAFADCTGLLCVSLPESLTKLNTAFSRCINLEKIWIPDTVNSIDSYAFSSADKDILVIHGVAGSHAEEFAAKYGYAFSTEPFEDTSATLSGTVTDAAGNPISGVTVTVYKGPTTNYPFGSTTTDSTGAWSMENVKVGSYYGVGFEKEGYNFTPSQVNLTVQDGVNTLETVIANSVDIVTYISTSQSEWYIDVNAAMSDVEVNASGNWYISETPDWLHLYVMDGVTAASAMESDAMPAANFAARITRDASSVTEYASGSHMLMCAEYNNSGADRDGIVALNIGDFVKKIFVKQAADTAVPTIEILRPSTNGSASIVAETVTTIQVAASNFKIGYITIYDASGNVIHEENFKQTEYSTKYTFPRGEYTIIAAVSDDSKAESGDVSMITASCTVSAILSTNESGRHITDEMVEYIKKREGFEATAEPDSPYGGDYTIGYGHRICSAAEWNNPDLPYRSTWGNVVWDEAIADEYLRKDVESFESQVIDLEEELSEELGYTFTFTSQQFDAIVSMYFNNVGDATDADNRLGKCLRNLSGSEDWQIRNGFITWHHDTYTINGKAVFCDVSGLYYRRLEESNIFLYGDYTVRYDWPHPTWLNIIEGKGYGPNLYDVPDSDWYSDMTDSVSVTPSKLSYTVNGGSSRFQVESGSNWTLTVPEDAKTWLTVDKYSGSSGDSVMVTAAANTDEVRTATITVKCNNSTRRVEVEQAGQQSTQLRVNVDWDALDVDESGVSIKHTGEIAWAEITATGGAGGYTYQIDVYCNDMLEMQTVRTTANVIGVIPNNSGRYHIVVNVRDAEGKVVSVKTQEVQIEKVNLRITEPVENGQVLYMSNLPMVRWTSIAKADHYAVYLKKHGASSHIINGKEVYNCYLDVSEYEEYIEENVAYNVWIEARNSNNVKIGDGALYVFSVGPLSAITITEPVTAEVPRPNGDYLHVEWDDVANATYYQITMRDLSTGDLLQGKEYYKVEGSAADFACSVLSEGHEYRVWIAAFDDGNGRIAESGMTFVYVPDAAIQVDLTSKIAELKNKLPAGSYWAHTPDTSYNEYMTNTLGCSCEYQHGESRRGIGGHQSSNGPGTDGSCGCNSYRGAIQCNGYARVICDYLFGSNWANESSKWTNVGTDIAVAKVGDVVCTTYDHYMVVSSVNNGVVKVTDCNYLTNCLIRWDASTSYFVEHDQIKWIKRCSDVEETQTPPTTEGSFKYATGVTPLSATRETALRSVMEKRAGSTNGYATQIYLIEGFGDDLSADGRGSAMCVVVKNGTIVYTNTSCATLPDQPFHAQSNPTLSNMNNKADWDDQPNVVDGVYSVGNVKHGNPAYPALEVKNSVVYRIHSKSCGGGTNGEIHSSKCGTTTSAGIHIHKKSSENCEIFTTDANGNNTGWVNSSGCAILPASAWDSFASAVGFTGGATISNTCVVYDRRYAYENVPDFKAYMQDKYTDTEGYAFDAGYYDETAVKKICGIQ